MIASLLPSQTRSRELMLASTSSEGPSLFTLIIIVVVLLLFLLLCLLLLLCCRCHSRLL